MVFTVVIYISQKVKKKKQMLRTNYNYFYILIIDDGMI